MLLQKIIVIINCSAQSSFTDKKLMVEKID